jgi:hypothetical protein
VDHDDGDAFKVALVQDGRAARWMTAQVALGSGGIGEETGTVMQGSEVDPVSETEGVAG